MVRRSVAVLALSLLVAVFPAAVASAQTTTIPPLPVTGGEDTTDEPADEPADETAGETAAGDGLATTGLAADTLGTLGVVLTGTGLALEIAARRTRRRLEPRVRFR